MASEAQFTRMAAAMHVFSLGVAVFLSSADHSVFVIALAILSSPLSMSVSSLWTRGSGNAHGAGRAAGQCPEERQSCEARCAHCGDRGEERNDFAAQILEAE
ncbi:hypothetical protein SLUN_11235 [Streptomyces lunaelactis]|uniref:Uncharacterized protein n=1 Tax=Streptomyces lunaelactis TaxID=1535768 RepID=A0A2R4T0P4_9ACTN|nr:hypothetical protein [Streptomyces lunaelactis]AVZ72681.1 hypothetical protein SLUN_11235 [Streptomyces lunaelactis]NUK08504.1 hypothetical protein [Streptomyces lunaelactis]NUK34443.1 hypothetical protein [Streptomyces lunaelactis]NUK43637.1 hypothetical protein [Streptomyces lunaelactis]NUK52279.1 hypothetical protein [Streptomyces lunaelactis]